MTLVVVAPLAGTVHGLVEVPDPVFAEQLVGAGAAVEPTPDGGPVGVRAPIAGTLVKAHPHAFIVRHESGTAVLVHLGIDTVELKGEGFTRHAAEGSTVTAGELITTFDPDAVRARGLSAITPVVVLDSAPDSIPDLRGDRSVAAGEPLYDWPG